MNYLHLGIITVLGAIVGYGIAGTLISTAFGAGVCGLIYFIAYA